MALTPRLAITPRWLRVAREGRNVLSPPSLTPEDLAFNSDWANVEQIHDIIRVPNTSLQRPRIVHFERLTTQPFGHLIQKRNGIFFDPPAFENDAGEIYQKHRIDWIRVDRAQLSQPLGVGLDDNAKWTFFLLLVKP